MPDYTMLAAAEWAEMYPDVLKDLAVAAARIPVPRLTVELVGRLVREERRHRLELATSEVFEDHEDFHRVWEQMLAVIERDPATILPDLLDVLPVVRAEIEKTGGSAYLRGLTTLGRREVALQRAALDVDADWIPRPEH